MVLGQSGQTLFPASETRLRLKSREVGKGEATELRGSPLRLRAGLSHYLLAFSRPLTTDDADRLVSQGVRIVGSIPGQGFVVAAPDRTDWTSLGAEWVGRLEAEDKVSAEISPLSGEAAFLVEAHLDVNREALRGVIRAYGLAILEHPNLLPHQVLVMGDPAQVLRLTVFDEVAYIFPASRELREGEPVVACAGAVSAGGFIGQYVKVGGGWAKDDSGYARLGVLFGPLTDRLPAETARAEIDRAFAKWSKIARVRFHSAASSDAVRTVVVFFAAGAHGDPYPFDGPSRVLAHTFYPSPPNSEPVAGDMHFDAEEPWGVGTGIDLYSVALHELGHALGLGHSDKPGSVMYPYYRKHGELTEDDIQGIRELYGAPDPNPGPEPIPPPPPPTPRPVPLQVTVSTPASTTVSTTAATLALAGVLAGGVAPYRVTWNNSNGGSGVATGSPEWLIAAAPLVTGENRITITAFDAANESASASVIVLRTEPPPPPPPPAGNALPDVQILSPAMTVVTTSSASIAIRGTASSSTRVIEWTNSVSGAGIAEGATQWSIPKLPLFVGINRITIRARDAAGNESWRSLTVTRK